MERTIVGKNIMGQPIVHVSEKPNPLPPVEYINSCRMCNSHKLRDTYLLGTQYVSGFVPEEDVKAGYPNSIRCPILMTYCENCRLNQSRYTVPTDWLYRGDYWYKSGVTHTMRVALDNVIARSRWFLEEPVESAVMIDIGSNDGTLLKIAGNVYPGMVRVGVEPASTFNTEEVRSQYHVHIPHLWDYWYYHNAMYIKFGAVPKAHLITALGMFYDLTDPAQFVADVAKALHQNGVFIIQLMCLAGMVRNMDLGNLAHEHVEFYTLDNIRQLLGNAGLEIVYVERNTVNVESYLIIAKHKGSIPLSAVGKYVTDKFNETEKQSGVYDYDVKWSSQHLIASAFGEVLRNLTRVYTFLRDEVALGKKVYVYGASTKGNVILQCMNDMYYHPISKYIKGAAEKSPSKYGLYTVGTGIKIMPEEEVRNDKPDYLMVMPHTFLNEFIERERTWLEGGGQFIVPVSGVKVHYVKATNKMGQVRIV